MRMRWGRTIVVAALVVVAGMPALAAASSVAAAPNRVPTIIASDLRETIDRAIGYKRPTGATYANGRGEIVSPRAAANSGTPRVHFTLLGSDLIAASINRRLRGLFGQHDAMKTSTLTPTHQR